MLRDLVAEFAQRFGRPPELAARAPGRVNLIGEHTDYNEGWVLPCAIDRDTVVLAARRDDARLRVRPRARRAPRARLPSPERRGDWVDYVQGPLLRAARARRRRRRASISRSRATCRGSRDSRARRRSASRVAFAALDAAQGLAPRRAARSRASPTGRRPASWASQCGIMDHFASALGAARARAAHRLPQRGGRADPDRGRAGAAARALGRAPPARRAAAMASASRSVAPPSRRRAPRASRRRGRAALRDLAPATCRRSSAALDPLLLPPRAPRDHGERPRRRLRGGAPRRRPRRARGRLLREGMAQPARDFEVSAPELDCALRVGDAPPGCYGSRLTGAGFGGCTLHLVAPGAPPEPSASRSPPPSRPASPAAALRLLRIHGVRRGRPVYQSADRLRQRPRPRRVSDSPLAASSASRRARGARRRGRRRAGSRR